MKVGIYCRLSEEDENKLYPDQDSVSIQNQKTMLVDYAVNQKWDIYSIYSDDDYKGSDRTRPEWNRLLKDAESGNIDIILCKSQSRFTRELELVEKYIHGLFLEWNIRFIGLSDNADTLNKGNKKSRQINGLVNEWYLEDLSDNVKTVIHSLQKKGLFIGNQAPYGYMKDPEDKHHLIIDPDASPTVKMIFEMYMSGLGILTLARKLNQMKILPPAEYKRQKFPNYPPPTRITPTTGLWTVYTLRDFLRNRVYCGDMVQHKVEKISYKSNKKKHISRDDYIIVPNTHEAIIDRDTFNTIQNLRTNKNKTQSNKSGLVNPLTGIIKCGVCGNSMHYHFSGRKDYWYFRCKSRTEGAECSGPNFRVSEIEDELLKQIKNQINHYADIQMLEEKYTGMDDTENEVKTIKQHINKVETKIGNTNKCLLNIYKDKVLGVITDNEYMEIKSGLLKEKANHDEDLLKLKERYDKITNRDKSDFDSIEQIVRKFINRTTLERDMVMAFVEKIVVSKNNNENVIDIFWRY